MKRLISILLSAVICSAYSVPSSYAKGERSSRFTSTFIQYWSCRDWTQKRWEQELGEMKSAGFDSLILQSVYDIDRGECSGENKQDPSAYLSSESYCIFPSSINAKHHTSLNDGDELALALEAAKITGMKLWLGTVDDDMWWNYGWGIPSSYFEDWCENNAELCSGLIDEIWNRYGEEYGDQIAGWYYTNEIWNIDAACDRTDNGEYARIIGDNIKETVDTVNSICPEKPIIISPFFNNQISMEDDFAYFIKDVVDKAGFRSIDIYAPQDGGGRNYSASEIRKWAEAQKKSVEGNMSFWINNESFSTRDDGSLVRKDFDELRENYFATADLAEESIIFSWYYYFNDNDLRDQYKEFITETIDGDVNDDGKYSVADLVILEKWLLGNHDTVLKNWKNADLCTDGKLDTFDLCLMRKELVDESKIVSNIGELRTAVATAKAGDTIKVAPGLYMIKNDKILALSEGTLDEPIILKALDPDNPPQLIGESAENGYILNILGDNWIIDGLVCSYSQKGIVLDNSNHSVIQNCEIYNIGAEAIAIRDGSSYCTVRSCNIHDTGLVSPGYGEGVYIGSSKEKTEFDFKCDHNKVIDCVFKNVAAEHVDVKEYTTDTEISGCTFYGDGMTGENYAGSFIDLKGNDCYVHDNIGYRNNNKKIVAAFEVHEQVEGWGYHHVFENNTLYMDQPYGAENTSRRMYVVDGWFSDFSVKNNKVDYGKGLVSADSREFYNSDNVTYLT